MSVSKQQGRRAVGGAALVVALAIGLLTVVGQAVALSHRSATPLWHVVHGRTATVGRARDARTLPTVRVRWNGRGRQTQLRTAVGARLRADVTRSYHISVAVAARRDTTAHRAVRVGLGEWRHGRLVHVFEGRWARLGHRIHRFAVSATPRRAGDGIGVVVALRHPRRSDRWDVAGSVITSVVRDLGHPPTTPTSSPTIGPTDGSTVGPTDGPTGSPTVAPTEDPTDPAGDPTASTTPTPPVDPTSGSTPADPTAGLGGVAPGQADPTELPITNQVANASAESATGFGTGEGAVVTRTIWGQAPDGSYVDEVAADGTDSSASLIRSVTGSTTGLQQYTAGAWVAAGTATAGQQVEVVVREVDASGNTVSETASNPLALTTRFTYLSATSQAKNTGDSLQVVVRELAPRPGDAFFADVTTLAATGSTLGALAINSNQEQTLGDTSKYAYVVSLSEAAAKYQLPAKIHAANPATKALVYLDPTVTQERSCPTGGALASTPMYSVDAIAVGIDYCWLKANGHLNWILRDSSGNDAVYADYAGDMPMDMSNPAYQKAFTSSAINVMQSGGWDGIYLDDVNTIPAHGLRTLYRADGSAISTTAYGDDMVSFLQAFKANMIAAGQGDAVRAGNVFVDNWTQSSINQGVAIARTLNVYNREHQSQWQEGSQCGAFKAMAPSDTTSFINLAATVVDGTGAGYSGIEYGSADKSDATNQMVMAVARASFLLSWDGRPGSAIFYRPCGATDPAAASWTTDLGVPTDQRSTLNSQTVHTPNDPTWDQTASVFKRDFTNGEVFFNELPTAQTVKLDGTFRTQTGQVVSGSYTLPPAVFPSASNGNQGLSATAVLLTRVSN